MAIEHKVTNCKFCTTGKSKAKFCSGKCGKIYWEIESYGEKIDTYSREVLLVGFNLKGEKYNASAEFINGEIDNITNIGKV